MSRQAKSRLRIIGGQWRGRKLPIGETAGLRPTPDRIRETLFNWLQPWVQGAECLDLFAGTGALGIEAVSRGAASATLVEQDRQACRAISESISLLQSSRLHCRQMDVLTFLKGEASPCDIVFLDPPYRQGLCFPVCSLLLERHWLKPGALVYLERESESSEAVAPAPLKVMKQKTAGQVSSYLLRLCAPGDWPGKIRYLLRD